METFTDGLLNVTRSVLGKLGLVTCLLDAVAEHLLPQTTARASGHDVICYTYCGAVCGSGKWEYYAATAGSEAQCLSGYPDPVPEYLGCNC